MQNLFNKRNIMILIILLIIISLVSLFYNIEVVAKLKRYEDYHSQEIGNSTRSAASSSISSKNILERVVKDEKINENQYQELENDQRILVVELFGLRYFANRVIDSNKQYDIPSDYMKFLYYLERFKYENDFLSGKFDHKNPKVKILTNEELKKFQIMKIVMTEYSDIFVNDLGDYKTGKLDNSSNLYENDYNVNNEKWILVLEQIFQYNQNSQYKDEF
ncbi:MAG: hypothetical protein ACOCUI_04175 [bacterium]